MKRSITVLAICCTLLIPFFSPSPAMAAASLKDVVATVEKSYNSLTDLQASFSQKNEESPSNLLVKSTGRPCRWRNRWW